MDSCTPHKFIAVLNKKIETGKLMNALGHMTAGLSHLIPDKDSLRFDTYIDQNGGEHKSISDNPFIILAADNSNQIRTLRNELHARHIPFTDFTHTMTVATFVEQKQRTRETPELELEYFGICLFGEITEISQLTRTFSLWK